MAYDRYDTRSESNRVRNPDFDRDRGPGRNEDRGFFERAGDEISSWFGGDESERRRPDDERMSRGRGRDFDSDRYAYGSSGREFERGRFQDDDRSSSRPMNWASSDRDDRSRFSGSDRDFGQRSASSGRDGDRHYHEWRQRQLDELDRDYDDYRREHQQRFESDFGTWRQTRQQKRGLATKIREQMEVVGSDGEQIGKVDKVRGDHIVLTKEGSDDDRHHSITCTMIDTVEGDQVRLDVPAEEAKSRWKDEDERGFFGRDNDEREVNLERSFSGTYR